MTDGTYAEVIAARGADNPERRADLSNALYDAADRLADAAIDVREALALMLEAQPEALGAPLPIDGYRAARVAVGAYEEAVCAVIRFLGDEGHTYGDPDHVHAAAAWDALEGADEERVADAAAGVLEGRLSRQEFAEIRRQVIGGRARLDAAVDTAVCGGSNDD